VKGTVISASTSTPIANVIVAVTVNSANAGGTTTDSSGNFSTVVSWAGASPASATVDFHPPSSGDRNYLSKSISTTVTDGGTTDVGTGQAFAVKLQSGGEITGTVTDALAGYGIANVQVLALDSTNAVQDSTCTANGTYLLQGLATDSYHVEFTTPQSSGCGAVGNYLTQYFNGKSSLVAADAVSVTAGSTTSGIDAVMAASASRRLTVSRTGTGSGTVTSSPAAIDCGSKCEADLADGTPVTLTAVAASGSTFTGWSGGGCSGTDPCQLTMSSDQAVTATFTTPDQTAPATTDQITPPAPSNMSTLPTAAKCSLVARGHKVKRAKKLGKLALTVTCDQRVEVTLTGRLKPKAFRLSPVHHEVTAEQPVTLALTIPARAMSALAKHVKESATVTLAATNANGTGHATATITRLHA
jgi:hypothetical protein